MIGPLDLAFFFLICSAIAAVLCAHIASLIQPHIKRKVGPSYWGVYEGVAPMEDASMRVLELRAPSKDPDGLGGSSKYSTGKTVKSARS